MSNKKAYMNVRVIDELESAIDLLCEEYQCCTPTEVLRICKFCESREMRTVVLEIAESRGYRISSSGRGFKIFDW